MRRKQGRENTAGQGVLQKKKDLRFQVFFVPLHVLLLPCRFVFLSPCSAAIRCVSSRPRSLFHAPAFPLLCALPSSPLFLLCAALPCAALFPLFFFPSPLLLSLLPVLPPPSQVIGFGPCLRALAERRGFEPLKPFRGLLAFQAGQFNHSCTFPKSKTLR